MERGSANNMTTQDIIKQSIEEFRAKFPNAIYANLTIDGLTSKWQANSDIQDFLASTLTKALSQRDAEIRASIEGYIGALNRMGGSGDSVIVAKTILHRLSLPEEPLKETHR